MSACNRATTHPVHAAPAANATAFLRTSILLVVLLAAPAALAQGGVRASGDVETEGQLISTAASGAPLAVASSEVVSSLNADLLDGSEASDFAPASTVAGLEATIGQLEALVARLHPRLDLANSRFRVTVTFDDGSELQPANPVLLGGVVTGGFFYFTRDFYPDVIMRMTDGRSINGHWWVFTAPLSDLAYTLRVEDVETGMVQSYVKPAGVRPTVWDTDAFLDTGGHALVASPTAAAQLSPSAGPRRIAAAASPSCVEDSITLCLVGNRFEVVVSGPTTGDGFRSVALDTSHSGGFGFGTANLLDLAVKIVVNPAAFVVNIGNLSNQDFTVTVTDTCTGSFQTYVNENPEVTNFVDDTTFPNIDC